MTVGLTENDNKSGAYRAPPAYHETASLRIVGEGDGPEYARKIAAPQSGEEGQTFDLVLRGEPGAEIKLRANGLEEATGAPEQTGAELASVLVISDSDRRYELHDRESVAVSVDEGGEVELQLLVGSTEYIQEETTAPEELTLHPPYPNPAQSQVTVEYALPEEANVRIAAYNALGQEVAILEETQQSAGSYEIQWDAGRLSSGTYFVRLEADGQTDTEQVVIVR